MHRIFVGFRCNNRCVFCAQGELSAGAADEDATTSAGLDAIQPESIVAFLGGEPTLAQNLPTWVRTARDRGAREVLVQTNGRRLADGAYTRSLVAAGVSRFEVALQGSTAAMHDFHTSAPGSFAQTGAGVRRARGEGARVSTTTVVTRSNYRHLAAIVDVVRTLGSSAHLFAMVAPEGRAAQGNPRALPPTSLAKPYVARALSRAHQTHFPCAIVPRPAETDRETDAGFEWAGLGPTAPRAAKGKAGLKGPEGLAGSAAADPVAIGR